MRFYFGENGQKNTLEGVSFNFFLLLGLFYLKICKGFFFGTIHPFLGWLVDIVRSLRLNLFKFSPFWGFILVKIAKKLLLKGWILSYFFLLLGLFYLKICKGFFFGTIHPFLGWLVDIVRSLRLNLFKFSPFWGFILVKIAKKLLLKGWILSYFFFLWLGLFSLKIGKGVFLAQFTLFSGVSLTFFILWGWISFNFHLFELLFWWKLTKIYSCNGKCFQILIFTLVIGVACVASVSARVRREKLGREQK